jgi:integrase
MAKTLKEAPITTRNARAKLEPGLYFKGIDPDVHLGYRKGIRGGVWMVRWRNRGPGANYLQAPLGTADDEIKEGTLDYEAARRAARATVEAARADAKAAADGPMLTVRLVVEAYIAERDARDSRRKGRAVRSDASRRLSRYVLGQGKRGKQAAVPAATLAGVAMAALTDKHLSAWRAGLPVSLAETTKQRLVNDLKAALHKQRKHLPPALVVNAGLKSDVDVDDGADVARENQILSDGQVVRLLVAARQVDGDLGWDGDLYRLVLVLNATGARFSQIARMRVRDCQLKESRLMVPSSRKGKGKSGNIAVPVEQAVIDALRPIVTGRAADAPLLERWQYRHPAGGIKWERAGRGPWQTSSEAAQAWKAIREKAGMPGVIMYALRHSSIVRGIKANLPIRLVAAAHDTSVQMIELHYSAYVTSGLEEMSRAAIVPLVPQDDDGKVTRLNAYRAGA